MAEMLITMQEIEQALSILRDPAKGKVVAIKHLRELSLHYPGLKETKEAVEKWDSDGAVYYPGFKIVTTEVLAEEAVKLMLRYGEHK